MGLRDVERLPRAEIRRHEPALSARRLRPRRRRADRRIQPRPARRRSPRPERRRRPRLRRLDRLRRRLPLPRKVLRRAHGLPVRDVYGLRARRRPRIRYGRRRRDLHRNRRVRRGRLRRRLLQRRRGLGADWVGPPRRQPIRRNIQGQRLYHPQPVHQARGHQQHRTVRLAPRHRPRRIPGHRQRLRLREYISGTSRRRQPRDRRRLLERRRGSGEAAGDRRAGRLQLRRSRDSQRRGRHHRQLLHRLRALRANHRPSRRGRLGGSDARRGGQHRQHHRQLLHRRRHRRVQHKCQRLDQPVRHSVRLRLFLGLHHKRHRRRHRHRHARRRADRRPADPDRLHRHILHVERERGRRRRRRRPVGLRLGRRLPDAEIRRHGPVDSARRLRPRQRRLDRDRHPRPARRRPPRPERQRRRDQRPLRRRLPHARHLVRQAHGLPVRGMLRLRAHRRPRLRYGRGRLHLHRNGRVRRGRPRRRLLQRRRGLRPDWQRQRQPLHLELQGQRTYHLQPVHEAPDHERHGAVRRAGRRSPRRKRGRQGRLRQRLQLDGHPRRHEPWDGRRLLEQRRGLWSRASRRAGWLASHRANNSQLLPRGDDRDGGIQQRLHRGRLGGGNKLDHAQRPRHRQLLHWNRRRHGRGPGGESQRIDGRLRRRRRNRVLLGHHRERHPGRRRRDHARRALDSRAASPDRLRRRLRQLERRRGRRSRRR